MNTTNTNEPIEPKGKQKGTLFVADLEMRDYFAAKAMQGLVAGAQHDEQINLHGAAEWSYNMADAMLKARQS